MLRKRNQLFTRQIALYNAKPRLMEETFETYNGCLRRVYSTLNCKKLVAYRHHTFSRYRYGEKKILICYKNVHAPFIKLTEIYFTHRRRSMRPRQSLISHEYFSAPPYRCIFCYTDRQYLCMCT